jgi:hypothetical protein
LPNKRKTIMFNYSQKHGFHRGRQWFGAAMRVVQGEGVAPTLAYDAIAACPVAAAFEVKRDASPTGWFSAKLDERLLAAIKHIIEAAGDCENGMEQYLKELESCDPVELQNFVESQYLAAVGKSKASKVQARRGKAQGRRRPT